MRSLHSLRIRDDTRLSEACLAFTSDATVLRIFF